MKMAQKISKNPQSTILSIFMNLHFNEAKHIDDQFLHFYIIHLMCFIIFNNHNMLHV